MAVENDLLAAFDASNSDVPQMGPTALLDAFDAQTGSEGGGLVEEAPKVDPDSFGSIVGRSVDNLQGSLGGTVEAIGQATGSDYLTDLGADFRAKQEKEAAKYGQPRISSYKQVNWTSPEDISDYFSEIGVSGGTSLAAVAPAAMAGAKLAPGALKPVGAMAGAFLASFGINAGEVQNAIRQVDPNGEHPWASLGAGTGMAALDAAGLGIMVKPFLKTFGKEVVYDQLVKTGVPKEMALGAIKGVVAEAPTESIQSLTKDITVANATDTELNVDKVMENAINSAIGGAVVGGGAGTAIGAATGISNNQQVSGGAVAPIDPTTGAAKATPRGLGGKTMEILGTGAAHALKPWSKVSPTAQRLLDQFTPQRSGFNASTPTIFEANDMLVGKYRTALSEGLAGKNLNKAIKDYTEGVDTPEAKLIDSTLKAFRQEATAKGLEVGNIERYLPTTLDKRSIQKNREQVIEDFAPYMGGKEQATKAVDNWLKLKEVDRGSAVPKVERLVDLNPETGNWDIRPGVRKGGTKGDPNEGRYKFAQGYIPPRYGHLEEGRMFAPVPQKIIEKYARERTGKAKVQAIYDYLEGGAHRINFVDRFGATGEKLNGAVIQAVQEAQQAGYNPTKDEVNRLYDMTDAYNGMLNRIEDGTAKTIISTGNAIVTTAALPLAVLSSLTEVTLPALRGDVSAALTSALPTIAQLAKDLVRTAFASTPRTEFALVASEANISLGAAMNVTAERLGENLMSRGAATYLNKFFLANGLTMWTHMVRVYGAKTADHIMKRNLFALASGLPVDSPKGRGYVNQLQSMGIPLKNQQDAIALYNPTTESERIMARHYRVLGIRRFTSQVVLEPNVANTPMWMHDGMFGILAGLKRYPAAFTNEILPHLYRRSTAAYQGGYAGGLSGAVGTLFILGMILSVGYVQDELKQMAKGAGSDVKDKRTEAQQFLDVLNVTLAPLHMGIVSDFFSAPRYGSDPISSVAGPLVGKTTEIAKSIYRFSENPEEGIIWKQLYNLTPAAPFRAGREAAAEVELFD